MWLCFHVSCEHGISCFPQPEIFNFDINPDYKYTSMKTPALKSVILKNQISFPQKESKRSEHNSHFMGKSNFLVYYNLQASHLKLFQFQYFYYG